MKATLIFTIGFAGEDIETAVERIKILERTAKKRHDRYEFAVWVKGEKFKMTALANKVSGKSSTTEVHLGNNGAEIRLTDVQYDGDWETLLVAALSKKVFEELEEDGLDEDVRLECLRLRFDF